MPDISVNQVLQKLEPLTAFLDPSRSQNQSGLVPMSLDAALAQPTNPSYLRSLDALLHASLNQSDHVVRSAAGGYMTSSGIAQRQTNRDPDQINANADVQIGLGMFAPRAFMPKKKDSGADDGRDEQAQQQARLMSSPSTQVDAVRRIIEVLQGQGLYQQSRTAGLVAPIDKDGLHLDGLTTADKANTFHELMKELVHGFSEELNSLALSSGKSPVDPLMLSAQVPGAVNAKPVDQQDIQRLLDDVTSFSLLQQNQSSQFSDEKTSVLDISKKILSVLAAKLKDGDLQANPDMMGKLMEALQVIMAMQPELANNGVGERLNMMKNHLATLAQNRVPATPPAAAPQTAMGAANAVPATSQEQSSSAIAAAPDTTHLMSSEEIGWRPVGENTFSLNNLKKLDKPKQYSTVVSGSVDPGAEMSGVGSNQGLFDSFAYQLKPNAKGDISILSSSGSVKAPGSGFSVEGKMALDDTGKPTTLSEGIISWNNGKSSIRMNSDGIGEVSDNGGKNWIALPNGQVSQHSSADGRCTVSYNPIDRKVQFMVKDDDGKRLASATITADGSAVSFSNLTSQGTSAIG